MQYLFQKFEEFQHCFQLKRYQQLKKLEAEILELIKGSNFENEESQLIKKVESEGSGSVKIDYAIWKKQIELGSIKSSKKIFQQICGKLEKIKNQEYLEKFLQESSVYYKREETLKYQLELKFSRGENDDLKSLLSEETLSINSIEKINSNIEFWASLENDILNCFFQMNNGVWSSDVWFYKQLLKFTFESILRKGKNERIKNFFKKITVKHKTEDQVSLGDDLESFESEKIENQIKFLIRIKNFSKALTLLKEIKDETKRKMIKTRIEKEMNFKDEVAREFVEKNSNSSEKMSKELIASLNKLEKVIIVQSNKEELVTYINFCVHSELFGEAVKKIIELEEKLEEEAELIDLKLLKAQLQIRDKQYTDALLELNDLLSLFPLKNSEIKLADRLIKKIMVEKER